MYTKTGLGLLAAAGLVFGVIGMHAGGASPASTADGCASTSTRGGSASGSATVPTTPTNRRGTESGGGKGGGSGTGTSSQGDLLTIDSSGLPGGGTGSVSVPNPASGAGNGGGSGAPAPPFLDVNGDSNGTALPGGGGRVPPANAGVLGRSQYLSRLLQLYANANANR